MSASARHPVLHYLRRVLSAAPAEGVPDAELVRRFAKLRDQAAFELLVWRHAAMVLRVCRGLLRDEHAAEDAFQATFLALARKAGSVGQSGALGGWLFRVARHTSLKVRQGEARRTIREARRTSTRVGNGPAEDATRNELGPLLYEELDRLAAKYREPLVLCYLEGKTYAEAACALGWAPGTVSGRLARARDLLRRRLIRRGVAPAVAGLALLAVAPAAEAVPTVLVVATTRAAVAFGVGQSLAALALSTPVVRLTEGVLHAMFLARVRLTAAVVLAVSLAVAGASVICVRAASAPPASTSAESEGGETPVAVQGGARGPEGAPDNRALESLSRNNLKQIALAFHNYHDVHGYFPANVLDADGRPLLSWRVLLLPYLQEDKLFKQFKLDEPWDSAHNKPLLAQMPAVFRVEGHPAQGPITTFYQGFHGKGAIFDPTLHASPDAGTGPMGGPPGGGGIPGGPPGTPGGLGVPGPGGRPVRPGAASGEGDPTLQNLLDLKAALELIIADLAKPERNSEMDASRRRALATHLADINKEITAHKGRPGSAPKAKPMGMGTRLMEITDGTSNTILVIEAGEAVPWSKPQDVPFDAAKPVPRLGGLFPNVIFAAMADGSVQRIRPDCRPADLKAFITRSGGEVVDPSHVFGTGLDTGNREGAMARVRHENASLEESLRQAAAEARQLRDNLSQLGGRSDRRNEEAPVNELIESQARLRGEVDRLTRELRALKDEVRRIREKQ
jgi:RNA polymerase sigma factor (sigma-70 family)